MRTQIQSRGIFDLRLLLDGGALAKPTAYVSLQTALFQHGMIEQISAVIYAVTLARPRRVSTPLGTISFHRVPPQLFTGFDLLPDSEATLAAPEKALFDVLHLAPGRSRIFSALPELTIPRGFRWSMLQDYTALVKSAGRRTFLEGRARALKRSRR